MRIIKMGEDFYCIAPKDIDFNTYLEKFLELSKVRKNSFAEKYLKKIYNCVFTGYVDMKKMYAKYYIDEYGSFEKYLYNKELLNNNEIKRLIKHCNEDYSVYKLNIDSNSYNISSYFKYDDNLIRNFNILIARLVK